MIHLQIQEILSLLLSIKYTHNKNEKYDYSKQPRPCHNFVFMLKGEGIIETSNETIFLKTGDILFIPKNTMYVAQWKANPKTIFHSLHFSFSPKNDPLLNKSIPIQSLDNTNFNHLYSLLKKIEQYQFSKTTDSFLALSAFFGLCGNLLQNIRLNELQPINPAILPAITYIQKNHKKKFSVEDLALLCNLSPSRFYCLFKRETGDSPIIYKNKITIQNCAQELLFNKNLTIKELSIKYGFNNPIYFERLFKKILGKTPSQYKNDECLL